MKPPALQISVLLADTQRLVREGLKLILNQADGIVVVAEVDNGHKVLETIRSTPVDVVIADPAVPGVPGIELVRRVASEHPGVALLVLASQPDVQFAARAFRAGANGHLTKDVSSEELIAAVRKVAGGGAYVTPAMAERLALLLRERSPNALHNELSDREFEVFRLIVAGKRNAEIAAALNLSVKTVSTHKSRLLAKLQLDSHAALIKYGMAHQLFDDGAPFY